MDDKSILGRITGLVDEEHRLRGRVGSGDVSTDEERARLREVQESLDQCWDLLRRRRAARANGGDPESAHLRNTADVERYLQ